MLWLLVQDDAFFRGTNDATALLGTQRRESETTEVPSKRKASTTDESDGGISDFAEAATAPLLREGNAHGLTVRMGQH